MKTAQMREREREKLQCASCDARLLGWICSLVPSEVLLEPEATGSYDQPASTLQAQDAVCQYIVTLTQNVRGYAEVRTVGHLSLSAPKVPKPWLLELSSGAGTSPARALFRLVRLGCSARSGRGPTSCCTGALSSFGP